MRRHDREVKDWQGIVDILGRCRVARVAYADEEGITIVPLSYGFTAQEGTVTLYFHSAAEGRKVRAFERGAQMAFEVDGEMRIVEGETACQYGCTFESVVGSGRAQIVTEEAERLSALTLLMYNQTGRTFTFTPEQARGVTVLKLVSTQITGKRRA